MRYYQEMLAQLSNMLRETALPYKDTIIIGDNSSGKSDVLKKLIQDDSEQEFYFIDAVNRYFDVAQIMPNPVQKVCYSNEINKHRMDDDNFNHKDSFYYGGTPTAIEDFYINYADNLKKLMKEFLQISFDIRQGYVGWEVYVNEEEVTLSSGYQALLRMFIECLYFAETKGGGTIVIDEIDEFLSVKNSGNILKFLCVKFPLHHFIVTTHSADLIANAENINLILLHENRFEVLDAGDFSSISQVYDIFDSVFGKQNQKSEKEKKDEELRILLNNKMSGIWGEGEECELQILKKHNLTKVQKLLVRQIEDWKI